MTERIRPKVAVTCPGCGIEREITRDGLRLIERGLSSGSCRYCMGARSSTAGEVTMTPLARSLTGSKFHQTWLRIWRKCTTPGAHNWEYYGARGIKVCDRWRSFDAFTEDMHPTYADGLSIERIDNDGDYEPGNCRWATMKEQNVNKRWNRPVTFDGRTQTISQWAEETGMDYFALRARLDRGWPIERALTTPATPRPAAKGPYTHAGRTLTLAEWSKETGIRANTIKMRLRYGWTLERALDPAPGKPGRKSA